MFSHLWQRSTQGLGAGAISEPSIGGSAVQSALADALLLLFPLVALVGADSARSFSRRASSAKQSLVVSIAPIGTLGLIATIVKASNLPGVKDMLGVRGTTIIDAARDIGCAAIVDGVVPTMDRDGTLIYDGRHGSPEEAACAIIKQDWKQCDIGAWTRAFHTFAFATMTGRRVMNVQTDDEVIRVLRELRSIFGDSHHPDPLVRLQCLHPDSNEGTVELQWPAPAMSLKTKSFIIYLYLALFGCLFLTIAALTSPLLLHWQGWLPSVLFLWGQLLLFIAFVGAQVVISHHRNQLQVDIRKPSVGPAWIMVDNAQAPSVIAQRPFEVGKRGFITLNQHHSFRNTYLSPWSAFLLSCVAIIGFGAFYIGARSSDIKTVAIYITLYILANVSKGPVLSYANRSGSVRVLRRSGLNEGTSMAFNDATFRSSTSTTFSSSTHTSTTVVSTISSRTAKPSTDFCSSKNSSLESCKIFLKFSLRNGHSFEPIGFRKMEDWIVAAHVIHREVRSLVKVDDITDSETDEVLQLPLYDTCFEPRFLGFLVMPTSQHDHVTSLFWALVAEFSSILDGDFCRSDGLDSIQPGASKMSHLVLFVFTCVRMLVSDHVYCGTRLLPCKPGGIRALMRAIEGVVNTTSNPQVHMPGLTDSLHNAAEAAKWSPGARKLSKEMKEYEISRYSKMNRQDVVQRVEELHEIAQYLEQTHHLAQQAEALIPDILPKITQSHAARAFSQLLQEFMQPDMKRFTQPFAEDIQSLLNTIQSIANDAEADLLRLREDLLWEESQELLKDDIRECDIPDNGYSLAIFPSGPKSRIQLLDVLRRREQDRLASRVQQHKAISVRQEEIEKSFEAIVMRLGAALQERENALWEELKNLLSLKSRGGSPSSEGDTRRRFQKQLDAIKQQQATFMANYATLVNSWDDLDSADEPGIRLDVLQRQQRYLEDVLNINHEVAFHM